MHLADRRRSDRRGLELQEEPFDRLAELLANDALDVGERERPYVVLEPTQLRDDVRGDDVGTRREELPELHERRSELVEHLPQVAAACARGAVLGGGALVPTLEDIPEPVPGGDLGDLAEAPDVDVPGPRGHGTSVARARAKPSWRGSRASPCRTSGSRGSSRAARRCDGDRLARLAAEQRGSEWRRR